VISSGWPARYEIRLEGVLDRRWSEWFEGLDIRRDGDDTVLSGTLPDQSALHGVLEKVRDLGLCVITLRRLPLDPRAQRKESPGFEKGES
jgi:hypothetical protein